MTSRSSKPSFAIMASVSERTDLLALAAELVGVASPSRHEGEIAGLIEDRLRASSHLAVQRVGDSVVARSELGRTSRLVLAGHLDTVPPFGDDEPRIEGETLHGLGAVDMKGGLAVLLDLAVTVAEPTVDVTYVFYACEEVVRTENALGRLAVEQPELLAADAAILGEPTGGLVEAGCQGTMRAVVTTAGRRAHTARPFTGVNAIHRLGPLLVALAGYKPRKVTIDGCEYAEQVQAVRVEGGIAGNVVPDKAILTVNRRFAPDRDPEEAEADVRALIEPYLDEAAGDSLEIVDLNPAAPPSLDQPFLAELVKSTRKPPRAKVGWTDVATFWEMGIPAANFGPGDPLLAHTPDERVTRSELDAARDVLERLIGADL